MANKVGRDTLLEEIKKGGSEPPCPFCRVPRVKRSDYIRCCACGINWLEGEALDKDPRAERQRKQVEQAALTSVKTKKEEPNARR